MANVVIVESPAKANTIKGYLGSNYKVIASKGHIRDLPKSTLGVDVDNNFEAKYINIRGKADLINSLKKECKKSDKVFLATDPDREGEAISWHLAKILGLNETDANRVTFNEITKTAVRQAIKSPRAIDVNRVDSQQARRILDRIVGYKISPYLWKKIKSGLSAGRVQSVATRLIVEREMEIRAFVPVEYWTLTAFLMNDSNQKFTAKFYGDKNGKFELNNENNTNEVLNKLNSAVYTVKSIKKSTRQKNPAPPFITSTMQQEANRKLNFQSQRTMRIAQELYEGVDLGKALGGTQGLISYMRTDSLRLSDEAKEAAKEYILNTFGEDYYPSAPRTYASKKNVQDAHEAIRPSNMAFTPEKLKDALTAEQYKLYKLIWDRFVASQMQSAVLDVVSVEILTNPHDFIFKCSGTTVKFAGFMKLYEETLDETNSVKENDDDNGAKLPELKEGESLTAEKLLPEQHFTQPPPRYTEATLIRSLEEQGIGRPSTYTPTITTIIQRDYVKREGKALKPTSLGEVTTQVMMENFPDIVDYGFTAKMETSFDTIEEGKVLYTEVLAEFYKGFKESLDKAEINIGKDEVTVEEVELEAVCGKCGKNLVIKNGRYGKYAACPNYSECKTSYKIDAEGNIIEKSASSEPVKTDRKCELCGADVVIRTGRFGEFYSCVNYPQCKFARNINSETGISCPKCGGEILKKRGKNKSLFYSCSKYPDCKFSCWDTPVKEKCPKCGGLMVKKKGKDIIACYDEKCGYTETAEDETAVE